MNWKDYLNNTKNKPARPLLKEALTFVTNKNYALDLGAGALNDTRAILANDFSEVDVVDSEPNVQELIDTISTTLTPPVQIFFYNQSFETFVFPKSKYDLINAQYSIPFIPPDEFGTVWSKIFDALACDGIFVGTFFGKKDGWNNDSRVDMTFHSLEEIEALFAQPNWKLIKLKEENRIGTTANGGEKYWHVFHIIARQVC